MNAVPVDMFGPGYGLARRQVLFFSCVLALTSAGTWVMADILWRGGLNATETALLVLFALLFGLLSLGVVQSCIGFFVLLRRRDPRLITETLRDAPPGTEELPATAIAVPIFNEDVSRVYEGIRAIYLSLARTGSLSRFDFFILSDSNDPNKWIEEEVAWIDLCKQLKGFGRIFYRKRSVALNKKSGNVSDFCRRWGRRYRYMVVLDADSLMDGRTLVRLVRLMEANPRAGIVQTAPSTICGRTRYARMLQFVHQLYGPLFLAGLNYWQGGAGNFWGHNAIVRLAPFIEHCALPPLTGSFRVLRARFMSHDYVEAALMRRAGYKVWLAYDLEGSYENAPPTLIDAARRDRRWCRGNLQHAWLVAARGFHPVNRLHLLLGILSYLASPLWLAMILLSLHQARTDWLAPVRRFDYDVGLSALLDIGGARLALLLFLVTLVMLTLPKILAWLLALTDWRRRIAFGGAIRLTAGVVVEHLLSALLAPVHMLFNTSSVIQILLGREVRWNAQRRDAEGSDWREAILTHVPHILAGALLGWIAWRVSPALFAWMSAVIAGLVLSAPLSIWLGGTARRNLLFVTPHERVPPLIVSHLEKNLAVVRKRLPPPDWLRPFNGLMQAVLDPYINATHCALLRQKRRMKHPATVYLSQLAARLLKQGPDSLNRREQLALLMHTQVMDDLHDRVWTMAEADLAPWWRIAMRHYNSLTARPATPLYR